MLDFVAQAVDPVVVKQAVEAVDFLSQKELRWWFGGLFLVLLTATGLLIWWLMKNHQQHLTGLTTQLTEQRTANSALYNQLIQYISGDHVITLQTIREVSEIMKQISVTLARLER